MPSLQKVHANVARHVKSMNKNLCANLIRHGYIVTGSTKAKRAQVEIESFLAKAINTTKKLEGRELEEIFAENRALNYLQPPDKREIGMKVIQELASRYRERSHGFTRIIKLERRLGEDRAPMSVLELVDSEYEVKFWYTAKIVARLELQELPLDDITKHNVAKLTQLRPAGESQFRAAVEEAKEEFFHYDRETGRVSEEMAANLANLPANLEYHGGSLAGTRAESKKFATKPRPATEARDNLPKSPYCK